MPQGNTVTVAKDSLRVNYKHRLQAMADKERAEQSKALASQLDKYLKNQHGVWTLFSPLNDEPNLVSLFQSCSHLQWVFPKVQSSTEMDFFKIESLDEMVASSWGLTEPVADPEQAVAADQIQGCLIPGLAFDRHGTRLGRGGGFYDRFLENFKGLKLGVTFSHGLTDEALPRKSHDQQMNIVVSPDTWIAVETSEVNDAI